MNNVLNFLELANEIVNEWRTMSTEERRKWCEESGVIGVYDFIEQWRGAIEICATTDDELRLAYDMIYDHIRMYYT